MLHLLANANGSKSMLSLMIWLAILLAIFGALVAILSVVRRRMQAEASAGGKDFSLGDLRSLHREGKLTDEEFDRAKARLVSAVQKDLSKDKPASLTDRPLGEDMKNDSSRL